MIRKTFFRAGVFVVFCLLLWRIRQQPLLNSLFRSTWQMGQQSQLYHVVTVVLVLSVYVGGYYVWDRVVATRNFG